MLEERLKPQEYKEASALEEAEEVAEEEMGNQKIKPYLDSSRFFYLVSKNIKRRKTQSGNFVKTIINISEIILSKGRDG